MFCEYHHNNFDLFCVPKYTHNHCKTTLFAIITLKAFLSSCVHAFKRPPNINSYVALDTLNVIMALYILLYCLTLISMNQNNPRKG